MVKNSLLMPLSEMLPPRSSRQSETPRYRGSVSSSHARPGAQLDQLLFRNAERR